MSRYILRRLAIAVPTIFGITVLIFIAMRVLPGDPLAMIGSQGQSTRVLTEEELASARTSLGLDRPLYVQYLSWLGDIARGDLGYSFWTSEPLSDQVLRRGPISAQIAIFAVIISWVIGVPVGLLSAVRRNSWLDNVSRLVVTTTMAVPSFWLGLVMVLLSVRLFYWRPPLTITQLWEEPLVNLQIVLGPAIALGIGLAAVIMRMTRSTALEVLGEDYVRTARAKGLGARALVAHHVFRNSLLPVITTSGVAIGGLLGGTVATETAFGVPGLGTLLVEAMTTRDWMMIQNLVLLYALIFVVVNLLIDLSYAWIDPRIRFT
ncbi:MAG: ABC transporter permease [Chloroflexia bacterium]|nr:ABC transporter permease [Chloroflexia bacterium]MDQ3412807.1 ABC transporter permease [Chloroflexota bacterium]